MFDKPIERAAKPTPRRAKDGIAFVVISGITGYYLNTDLDIVESFGFTPARFEQWITGNDSWERVTSFCNDPDLMVADGL